jgi:hypothetical protein
MTYFCKNSLDEVLPFGPGQVPVKFYCVVPVPVLVAVKFYFLVPVPGPGPHISIPYGTFFFSDVLYIYINKSRKVCVVHTRIYQTKTKTCTVNHVFMPYPNCLKVPV